MHRLIVFASVLGGAVVANAAAPPTEKCQAGKTQEAGKYSASLHKAAASGSACPDSLSPVGMIAAILRTVDESSDLGG